MTLIFPKSIHTAGPVALGASQPVAVAQASTCRRALRHTVLGILLAGAASAGWAATVSFSAIGGQGKDVGFDGTFDELTNFGSYRTGRDSLGDEYRWAIEFNMASLPAGAVIQSAFLRLRTSIGSSVGQTQLNGYAGDGTVSLADMTAGTALLTFTPASAAEFDNDVSSFVLSTFAPGQTWMGFNVRKTPVGAPTGGSLSWNSPNNSPAPALIINYTVAEAPEPTSAMLVALGLGALLRVRARPASRQASGGRSVLSA